MLITTEQRNIANQLNKMETFSKLRPPDAVKIKVKIIQQINENVEPLQDLTSVESNFSSTTNSNVFKISNKKYKIIDIKKFCVDPLITSFEILSNLIAQAFGIKEEFQMSYLNRDSNNSNTISSNLNSYCPSNNFNFVSLFNDWDLDAAFSNSSQPYLSINVELNSHNKSSSSYSSRFKLHSPLTHQPNSFDSNNELNLNIDSSTNNIQAIYDEWEVINTNDLLLKTNQHQPSNESSSAINTSKNNTKSNLNRSKNYNVMNLDPAGRSLIALWSNTAADKAVSVFQRVLNGLSRSGSLNVSKNSNSYSRSNSIPNNDIFSNQTNNLNPNSPLNIFDINIIEQSIKHKQPLGDSEYKNFLDSDGRIVQPQELRQRIFDGGCDPSKRKELWPILLEIFPNQSMTAKQRVEFIKQKSIEYEQLKQILWYKSNKSLHKISSQFISDSSFDSNNNNSSNDEAQLYSLAHKIHKDVWRTDRNNKFYAGDSNKNVESLFNILMTYSLSNEGSNSYSQGMSDLLSPLLFVLKDEALAYLCFCSLMKRCLNNFDVMSYTITTKIKLLSMLIIKYDPELWSYLIQVGADQLLFVYRWLLIECKREFPFNDSLRVLEIMWSTTTQPVCQQEIQHRPSESRYGRSNSNASSISLKLLKQLGNSNIDYLNDDYLISNDDEEFSDNLLETSSASGGLLNKSRHQSQQSQQSQNIDIINSNFNSNNNNNNNNIIMNNKNTNNNNIGNNNENNSTCDICLAGKSIAKTTANTKNESSNNSSRVHDDVEEESFLKQKETDLTSSSSSDEYNSTDTDLESINGFNYYNRLCKRRERLRRLSLNSSFFSHKNRQDNNTPTKILPSSLNERNDNFYLLELKEQQLEDKHINQRRVLNYLKQKKSSQQQQLEKKSKNFKQNFSRKYTGSILLLNNKHKCLKNKKIKPNLSKSFSSSCCYCFSKSSSSLLSLDLVKNNNYKNNHQKHKKNIQRRSSSIGNLDYSNTNLRKLVIDQNQNQKRLPFLLKTQLSLSNKIGQSTSPSIMSSSLQNGRFSTSEAETITLANNLRNSITHHQISDTSSLSDDLDKWPSPLTCDTRSPNSRSNQRIFKKSFKLNKRNRKKRSNNLGHLKHCSSPVVTDNESNEKNLFKNVKKSLKRSHNRINKCFSNNLKIEKENDTNNTTNQLSKTKLANSTDYIETNLNESNNNNNTRTSPKLETKDQLNMCHGCSCTNSIFNSFSFDNNSKLTKSTISSTGDTNNKLNTKPNLVKLDSDIKHHHHNHHNTNIINSKNNSDVVYHKNSTSSKSSTSAYVSAASVASSASSISSSCSTPYVSASKQSIKETSPQIVTHQLNQTKFPNLPIVSTSIPMVKVTEPLSPLLNKKSFDDEEEEELIYSLSKLDNPFLLFLCFAMFLENRDHIINSQMDSNDIACYFDKMTRKHNMKNILNRARYLYTKLYLAKANVFNYIQQLMDIQNSP